MSGGRPLEYDFEHLKNEIPKFIAIRQKAQFLPTIEGLALHLNVSRETLYSWKGQYPEFSDILEKLMATQGDQLIQNGLIGHYNSTITKLMLSKHGYVERQELTGKDGEPLFDDQTKAKAAAAIKEVVGGANTR